MKRKQQAVINYLNQHYKTGDFIYPNELKLNVSMMDIYGTLENCAREGDLKQYLDVCCPYCKKFVRNPCKTVFDIPKTIVCRCGAEIRNPAQYAEVIFQK